MVRLLKLVIILAGITLGVGLYCNTLLQRPIDISASNYYLIPNGQSFNALSRDLISNTVLGIPEPVFKLYALLTRYQGTIKAGEYELTRELNAKTLLLKFRQGEVLQRQITFPEGWDFSQWVNHLDANEYLIDTLTPDSNIMHGLESSQLSPEGQFFPDTYRFTRGATDFSILKRAHVRMKQVLEQEWDNRDRSLSLTSPQQALVLASIVEKETGYEPDRVVIASVFNNRLQKRMRLQSDPTVIYGLDGFSGDLKRSDLKTRTPYNTYVINGLPPTPICNPGMASIRASLNPEPSAYYYFVARGDGSSEFSETLAQHNAAVTRFQKAGRVDGYRSTPHK